MKDGRNSSVMLTRSKGTNWNQTQRLPLTDLFLTDQLSALFVSMKTEIKPLLNLVCLIRLSDNSENVRKGEKLKETLQNYAARRDYSDLFINCLGCAALRGSFRCLKKKGKKTNNR